MGFCGLDHWVESDDAADEFDNLMKLILKKLWQQTKYKSNEFNTSGPENVLLIMNSLFMDPQIRESYANELARIYNSCDRKLRKDLEKLKKNKDQSDPGYLYDLQNLLKKSSRKFR